MLLLLNFVRRVGNAVAWGEGARTGAPEGRTKPEGSPPYLGLMTGNLQEEGQLIRLHGNDAEEWSSP